MTIDRLGHLGDGIAETPDGAVFVPQMLPGEQVEGDLSGDSSVNHQPNTWHLRPRQESDL